jgi:hypothetical protein
MVKKITFKNNSNENLEILIEPAAEYIDLEKGCQIIIELVSLKSNYNDELAMVIENNMLIIYESRQCRMKIFKNNELMYYTAHNGPII